MMFRVVDTDKNDLSYNSERTIGHNQTCVYIFMTKQGRFALQGKGEGEEMSVDRVVWTAAG